MDIGSKAGYPASALSNFAPHPFVIDGVECNSMEGFLQSLKFSNPDMQKHVCTLVGLTAKYKGKRKKWWTTQTLYWLGKPIDRHSDEYTQLIERAYNELAKNESFKRALLARPNATLTHSIGKSDKSKTVLTEREFISNLNRLRAELKKEENYEEK